MNVSYKYVFDIHQPLSESLCEFIGAFMGDGYVCTTNHVVAIAGDRKRDYWYHKHVLGAIARRCFNITPKIQARDTRIDSFLRSKLLYLFLTSRFGFPEGAKSKTVRIPDDIQEAGGKHLLATIRGLFDTDGGVHFDRRSVYAKPYVRLNYTTASKVLAYEVSDVLWSVGIPHSLHHKNEDLYTEIQINGVDHVQKYLDLIGFSNPRHINKVKHLLNQ